MTALDLSPDMLAQARPVSGHSSIDHTIMDAMVLAFPDGAFDAVLLNLILSVVPDGHAAAQEAWRVLRPGGRDVPSPPSPDAYVLQLGMSQTRRIVVHTRRIVVHTRSGRPQYEVTDPQVIASVVAVLRAGSRAAASPGSPQLDASLQLDLVAGPPERVVTAHYNPQTLGLGHPTHRRGVSCAFRSTSAPASILPASAPPVQAQPRR